MKKLLIVMAVALLAIALVACGGETATTTDGGNNGAATTTPAVTTPKNETPATNPTSDTGTITTAPTTSTVPATTSKAPETTTPPETYPPVETIINELIETSWWNQVHRKNDIAYSLNADGTKSYTWSLTIKAESGLLPQLGEDHPEYPNTPTIQLTSAEGARVFIKDVNKDTDYTEYKVTNWKTARWCDISFEAESFVPTADGEYDMFLFFVSPEYSTNPGELIYVWALEETWKYNAPVVSGDPEIDALLAEGYRCNVHRHSERHDVSYALENAPEGFDPATFPTLNFNFTVKAEDNLFPHLENGESFQNIIKEGAFVYLKGKNDDKFTRYDIDYMLLERWCDMWFTLEGFTPVAGETYEMYVFFTSGVGATHEYARHYAYANNWSASAPAGQ